MPPYEWSQVISASVVPVVIISACGLLCLTFYNRLSNIASRHRGFHRERLMEQQEYARALFSGTIDRLMLARHPRVLESLELQTNRLLRRAHLVRRTLICLLGSIGCLTACSLVTGLSTHWAALAFVALGLFFAGLLFLLAAVILALVELKDALGPVEMESIFVTRLSQQFADVAESGDDNGI